MSLSQVDTENITHEIKGKISKLLSPIKYITDDLYIFPLMSTCWYLLSSNYRDMNITSLVFLMWRYNNIISPNSRWTYYCWFVLLKMDFSSHLTFQPLPSRNTNHSTCIYISANEVPNTVVRKGLIFFYGS